MGQGESVSSLREAEEMDVVLSDEEEQGAGEGKCDGKLVLNLPDDDLSLEERRALQTPGQGHHAPRPGDRAWPEDIESGLSSLSLASDNKDSRNLEGLEAGGDSNVSSDKICDSKSESSEQGGEEAEEDLDKASIITNVSSATEATLSSMGDGVVVSSPSGDGRVHVHLDNANFNTFQYWRSPLPEVDIDFDIINGAPANIHVVAKVS